LTVCYTELVTAAARKLSSEIGQCDSANDSCPPHTFGNVILFGTLETVCVLGMHAFKHVIVQMIAVV